MVPHVTVNYHIGHYNFKQSSLSACILSYIVIVSWIFKCYMKDMHCRESRISVIHHVHAFVLSSQAGFLRQPSYGKLDNARRMWCICKWYLPANNPPVPAIQMEVFRKHMYTILTWSILAVKYMWILPVVDIAWYERFKKKLSHMCRPVNLWFGDFVGVKS